MGCTGCTGLHCYTLGGAGCYWVLLGGAGCYWGSLGGAEAWPRCPRLCAGPRHHGNRGQVAAAGRGPCLRPRPLHLSVRPRAAYPAGCLAPPPAGQTGGDWPRPCPEPAPSRAGLCERRSRTGSAPGAAGAGAERSGRYRAAPGGAGWAGPGRAGMRRSGSFGGSLIAAVSRQGGTIATGARIATGRQCRDRSRRLLPSLSRDSRRAERPRVAPRVAPPIATGPQCRDSAQHRAGRVEG